MNWWKFYLGLFLLLIPFFPAKPLYIVFFTLATVYWGGGGMLRYAFQKMEVSRTSDSTRLFPGEMGEISITLQNRTMVPLAWLSGHENLPLALEGGRARRWVLSLGPLAKESVSYSITASDRGFYTTGPLDITAGEPLGLHQFSASISSYHNIVVYPRIFELSELGLPSRLPYGNIRTRLPLFPDSSRLAGVRPYEAGDPRQSIHWKLSARTGELQVKQFQHTVAVDTIVCLNLDADDYLIRNLYLDSELAIETAASLANYLAHRGETFGLVTNGCISEQRSEANLQDEESLQLDGPEGGRTSIRLLPRKGISQLMQILEALARVQCSWGAEFVPLLTSEAGHLAWGTTFLVVTPVDSPELVETATALVRRGYQVLIFVVGARILHPQLLYRTSQSPLQLFRVQKSEPAALDVL
ncbi:MAG: DUF58 domain-containing protein [Firmicutes bacterium]|nr:DUF58 domain-containing protein [Bacillota bacterium]